MGGKSKKQTVGYKYYLGRHDVLCHGPIDAITRISVDDRVAWTGFNTGSSITIDQPSLFGGEGREGGVGGTLDIAMGGPAQGQNSYLVSKLGNTVPGYRGVVSAILRQFYQGNNPYLKAWSYRGQRVQTSTDGNLQWYPSRAPILVDAAITPIATYGFNQAATAFGSAPSTTYSPGRGGVLRISKPRVADSGGLLTWDAWSAWNNDAGVGGSGSPVPGQTWDNRFEVWASNGGSFVRIFSATEVGLSTNLYATADEAYEAVNALLPLTFTGYDTYRVQAAFDNNPGDNRGGISLLVQIGTGSIDLNPAHIIRECLTNADWGMGYSEADVDETSFVAAANTLQSEGLGMSLLWDRQVPLEDFIQEIVKHIDAALYVDRTTGKFVLKLIRADYDIGSLITLDESNVSKVANPARATFGELYNSVTVNYWDAQTGKDASLTVTDTALVQQQGVVINTTVQYPGFSNARNATIAGQRDLRVLSAPFLSCTIYADSTAKDLNIGDTFKFSWSRWSIEEMVMRVTGIAFGDGKTRQVRITCTQDVYSTPVVAVVAPTGGTEWVDPSAPPSPAGNQIALEAPYYELVQALGQSSTDSALATNNEAGYVLAAAARSNSAINARVWTDDGAGYEDAAALDFCPYAELSGPIGKTDTSFLIEAGEDLDQVVVGQHCQIGDELLRVDAIDTGTNTLTVGRGVLDTVPQEHEANAGIYFWDLSNAYDPTEYVDGEEIGVKVLPVSGAGAVALSDAVEMLVTLDQRAFRPYAPGNLTINGDSYEPNNYEGELTIAWAHRDRLQQTSGTLADHFDGDIGPEAGTTYRLQGYVDDVLVHTEDDIAGTSTTWTPSDSGVVKVEVHAKRDGIYSYQAPWHEFIYGSTGLRATEAGDDRYTEEGTELRNVEE